MSCKKKVASLNLGTRFVRSTLTAFAAAVMLAGCSGGGSGERLPPTDPDPDTVAAGVDGRWSAVFDWPFIPIHVVLLPDGRVFSFGTDDGSPGGKAVPTGQFVYDIWNPLDGTGTASHLVLPNFTDVDTFCAAQLVLPVRAGQPGAGVAVIGGDTFPRPDPDPDNDVAEAADDGNEFSTVLDYAQTEPTLDRGNDMAAGRWYATVTTLLNGETFVQGGNTLTRPVSGELFPEIRSTTGIFRSLNIDTSELRYYYPRNFVAPDGKLFGWDTTGEMYTIDPVAPSITRLGSMLDDAALPDTTGDDSTVAMFAPGRLVNFGGNSRGAIILDISRGAPVLTATGRLSTQRRLATATILPTGQVLATGGSPVYNTLPGVNYTAEIWDPVSGVWTRHAEAQIARLYHSTALLLPDATVLVGGGGAPGPADNLNAEIYSPPYLFDERGAPAARPVINSLPSTLTVGREFQLGYTDLSGTAARVVLIKSGSTTHGLNFEQRFVELPFTTSSCSAPSCLSVRMPSNPADVPPGYYLLFVLNDKGVPSRARFVFLGVAAAADPAQDPSLVRPADRTATVGTPVRVTLSASDPNAGTTLRYAAAGLPKGLSVRTDTGVISGTPEQAGQYNVVVSVSDGTAVPGKPEEKARTASANFVWTVAAPAAP